MTGWLWIRKRNTLLNRRALQTKSLPAVLLSLSLSLSCSQSNEGLGVWNKLLLCIDLFVSTVLSFPLAIRRRFYPAAFHRRISKRFTKEAQSYNTHFAA